MAHTHEVQWMNKSNGKWFQLETFETKKQAEAAMKKQQKKAKFGVYRIAPITIIDNKYNVGTKVRITSIAHRTDGLIETQTYIAVVTKNDGYRADYDVLYHEVEENVLRIITGGGFVIEGATYEIV